MKRLGGKPRPKGEAHGEYVPYGRDTPEDPPKRETVWNRNSP